MRLALTVLAVAAALAVGLQSAGAVHNARYCMRGGSTLDCSYNTREQCRAAMHGHHTHTCIENPRLHHRNR
jgi:hypothetical protein